MISTRTTQEQRRRIVLMKLNEEYIETLTLSHGPEGYYLSTTDGEQWTPVGLTVSELITQLHIAIDAARTQ